MTHRFKRIGLWGRFSEETVAEPARQLAIHLNERAIEVFASAGETIFDTAQVEFVPESELGGSVDLLVAIGGDGNLLRATRRISGHAVPLIGINRGRLGFLTDVRPDQMLATIDSVLDGDYLSEERLMLRAVVRESAECRGVRHVRVHNTTAPITQDRVHCTVNQICCVFHGGALRAF